MAVHNYMAEEKRVSLSKAFIFWALRNNSAKNNIQMYIMFFVMKRVNKYIHRERERERGSKTCCRGNT